MGSHFQTALKTMMPYYQMFKKFFRLQRKILGHPTKYLDIIWNPKLFREKFIRNMEIEQLPVLMHSFPIHYFIEVSSLCNLQCVMCNRNQDLNKDDSDRIMSAEFFNTIHPALAYAHRINFFGSGEPFLNPLLSSFVSRCTGKRVFTSIFTNGALPQLPDRVPELLRSGLNEIAFSIDAATPETYRKIRGTGNLATVWRNLEALSALRNRLQNSNNAPRTQINVNFVLMRSNFREVPLLVPMLDNLGVDYLRLIHLAMYSPAMETESVESLEHEVSQVVEQSLDLAGGLRLRIALPLNQSYTKKYVYPDYDYSELAAIPYPNFCVEPWRTMFIQSDGGVPLCCYDSTVTGNIRNSDVMSIWNSARIQELRFRLKSGNPPDQCIHCPRFAWTSSPFYRFNSHSGNHPAHV